MHPDQVTIDLKLFATFAPHTPPDATNYPIKSGMSVEQVLQQIKIPPSEVKLIFINGIRGHLDTPLQGGERVGIFPPVGGG
jgi:molybdopterin converting factor small subunit